MSKDKIKGLENLIGTETTLFELDCIMMEFYGVEKEDDMDSFTTSEDEALECLENKFITYWNINNNNNTGVILGFEVVDECYSDCLDSIVKITSVEKLD